MSAVQIAGCSGAGKTAIAAALARRGLASTSSFPAKQYLSHHWLASPAF